jgi:hypothetical protein
VWEAVGRKLLAKDNEKGLKLKSGGGENEGKWEVGATRSLPKNEGNLRHTSRPFWRRLSILELIEFIRRGGNKGRAG